MVEIPSRITASEAALRSILNYDVLEEIFQVIRATCNRVKTGSYPHRRITINDSRITKEEVKYLRDLHYQVSDYFDGGKKVRIYTIEW
jgi:hypothetical protein